MHKIYENVYIGKFIFLLGMIAERERKSGVKASNFSINLYQQTPRDPTIGDFFSSLNGRNLLIEFKKDQKSIDIGEIEKQKEIGEKLISADNQELATLSYSSHFIGVGISNEGISFDINFNSYPLIRHLQPNSFPMLDFIEKYVRGDRLSNFFSNGTNAEKHTIGYNGDLFLQYLDLLASLYDGGRASSTGGLIVNLSEDGNINCLSFPDIQSLFLKLSELNKNLEQSVSKAEQVSSSEQDLIIENKPQR